MGKVSGLNHITFGVRCLESSKKFYMGLLDFQMINETSGVDCHLICNDLWLVLVLDENVSPSSGYSHVAFSCSKADFPKLAEKVNAHGAEIWQKNKTFGDSIYFKDPDGHKLEFHSSNWRSRFKMENK